MKNKFFKKIVAMFAALGMLSGCNGLAEVIQNEPVSSLDESGTVLHVELPEKENLNSAQKAFNRICTELDFEFEFLDETKSTVAPIEVDLVEGSLLVSDEYTKAVSAVPITGTDELGFSNLADYHESCFYGSKYYKVENGSRKYTIIFAEAHDETGKLKEGYNLHTPGRVLKVDLNLVELANVSGYELLLGHPFKITMIGTAYATLVSARKEAISLEYNSEAAKFIKIVEQETKPEEGGSGDITPDTPETGDNSGETTEPSGEDTTSAGSEE